MALPCRTLSLPELGTERETQHLIRGKAAEPLVLRFPPGTQHVKSQKSCFKHGYGNLSGRSAPRRFCECLQTDLSIGWLSRPVSLFRSTTRSETACAFRGQSLAMTSGTGFTCCASSSTSAVLKTSMPALVLRCCSCRCRGQAFSTELFSAPARL